MTRPSCEDTTLVRTRDLHHGYYSFTLAPYSRATECHPGSFVHLRLTSTDVFLRRAMSVASINPRKHEIEIIFKVYGRGTTTLAHFKPGSTVNLLGPLGVGFSAPRANFHPVLVAGGVGFPPLMFLAQKMINDGVDPKHIHFFYGGRTEHDLVERNRIKKLGIKFYPVTEDGTAGVKGLVTQAVEKYIAENHGKTRLRLYGCGPGKMLKAVDDLGMQYGVAGQVSLEAPMPCGVGICLGCVVNLRAGGHVRVCTEGPVFEIGEVML